MNANNKVLRWALYVDSEHWTHESLSELIGWVESNGDRVRVGQTVFMGEGTVPDKLSFLPNADHFIDMIADRAYDVAGEYADQYPHEAISKAGKDALNKALRKWGAEHLPEPDFFIIDTINPFVITEECLRVAAAARELKGGAK